MENDLVGEAEQVPVEKKKRSDFLPSVVLLTAVAACSAAAAVAFAGSLHLKPPAQAQEYDRDSAESTALRKFLQKHAVSKEKTEKGTVYRLKEADAAALNLTSDINFLNMTREDLLSAYAQDGIRVETVSDQADLTVTEQYGTDSVYFIKTQRLSVPQNDCLVVVKYDLCSEKIHQISIGFQEDTEDLTALCGISSETLQIVQNCLQLPDSYRVDEKELLDDFSRMEAKEPAWMSGFYLGREAKLLIIHTDASFAPTIHFVSFEDGISGL